MSVLAVVEAPEVAPVTIEVRMAEHFRAIDGEFVAHDEAERFVEEMERDRPAEFEEWLRAGAVRRVAVWLQRMDMRRRRSALESPAEEELQDTVVDPDSAKLFLARFTINPANVRRPLKEMTAADLNYAATGYDVQANKSLAMSAFLRALAKQVAKGEVVEDVMSEAECERLLRSFVAPELFAAK